MDLQVSQTALMANYEDLTGRVFTRLKVQKHHGCITLKNGKHIQLWECECLCGNTVIVRAPSLKSGNTKSCGCLRADLGRTSEVMLKSKHNSTHTRLFRIWRGVKSRCYNPNVSEFKNYGGRGIKMYDEWIDDFESFQKWALQNGYAEDLTIDRVNNDGDYTPDNCRWTTAKVQQNNTRHNRLITFDNRTQTLKQWSEEINVPYDTLWRRLDNGWSIGRALTTPLKRQRNSK